MATLVELTGKEHLSNSSLSTWLRCGEAFKLERIDGHRSPKGWAMLAGLAIHSATEALDKGEETVVQKAWDKAWAYQLSTLEANEQPRAGGKVSKEWPNKEDGAFWTHHGPKHVQTWINWRDEKIDEGWDIIGIETPFEVELEGVKVVGHIDRILVDPHGQQAVLDLKSGMLPQSPVQLAVYAVGMELAGLGRPTFGGYFLTRSGKCELNMLDRYSPELVGSWFASVARGIESEIFVPQPNNLCGVCGVRSHCSIFGDRT